MNLLLDTCTLVWWLEGDVRLIGRIAVAAIESRSNRLFASAVSAYEIGQTYRLGKWPSVALLADSFDAVVAAADFRILDLTSEQAPLAAAFPAAHKDPFDRMIAAQSIDMGMPVLSDDAKLEGFGAQRIW